MVDGNFLKWLIPSEPEITQLGTAGTGNNKVKGLMFPKGKTVIQCCIRNPSLDMPDPFLFFHVCFCGWLPDSNILEFYKKSDLHLKQSG